MGHRALFGHLQPGGQELTRRRSSMQEEGLLFFDKEERGHQGVITDLQMSPDGTYFITSSKDKSAKVCARGLVQLSRCGTDAFFASSRSGRSARTRTRTETRST